MPLAVTFMTTAFTNINAGLSGVSFGDGPWCDYNNDGYLDLLLTGFSPTGALTRLYRNLGNGTFTNSFIAIARMNFRKEERVLSPHPGPLPWGEGESMAIF